MRRALPGSTVMASLTYSLSFPLTGGGDRAFLVVQEVESANECRTAASPVRPFLFLPPAPFFFLSPSRLRHGSLSTSELKGTW